MSIPEADRVTIARTSLAHRGVRSFNYMFDVDTDTTTLSIRPKANAGWRLSRAEIRHSYRHGPDWIFDTRPSGLYSGGDSPGCAEDQISGVYSGPNITIPACKGAWIEARPGETPHAADTAHITLDATSAGGLATRVSLPLVTRATSWTEGTPRLQVKAKIVLCRPVLIGLTPCRLYVFTDVRPSRSGHEERPCNHADVKPPTCTLTRYDYRLT
ncbi:MAG: hypothetical protein AB1416_05125 [Actinomycetota bacterium]